MLDKQDLQAIREMMKEEIAASEERMKTYVNGSITASEERMKTYVNGSITASEERMKTYVNGSITASEERMKTYIDGSITASEERTQAEIRASENRTHAYIESSIVPQIQVLAEGHQTILETLAPKSRVETLEDDVVFLKSVVMNLAQDVAQLKKAL